MSAFAAQTLSTTDTVTFTKQATDTTAVVQASGTFTGATLSFYQSLDGTNYLPIGVVDQSTGNVVTGNISVGSTSPKSWLVKAPLATQIQVNLSALGSGSVVLAGASGAFVGTSDLPVSTPATTGLISSGALLSSSPTAGVGYTTGSGGTVTQATSRTTGVTLNTVTGQITTNATSLAAAAYAQFTVTNSTMGAADTVNLSIASGSNSGNSVAYVSGVAAGSFKITVYNAATSTAETGAIVINYAIEKGSAS
ncbi:hypothetical protein [Fimbriiglobus ruber]|uniref:Uncharacterized protein n=1 Tax=Fimbriiglobus ruber TaxID=1908690 RepID=A0A225D3U3_9BACT|nr:hypothetical protein [Fimbriiglobus ruber]OWK34304.1 hypothetical protein FRUB_10275 [Fimbriiglobus ruber]